MKIVMMGATGAVGGQVVHSLLKDSRLKALTLLGRRSIKGLPNDLVRQHVIDVLNSDEYSELLAEHDAAICTLGVGQPSKRVIPILRRSFRS